MIKIDITELEQRLVHIENTLADISKLLQSTSESNNEKLLVMENITNNIIGNVDNIIGNVENINSRVDLHGIRLSTIDIKIPEWDEICTTVTNLSGDWVKSSTLQEAISAERDYTCDINVHIQTALATIREDVLGLQKEELDTHRSIWRSLADSFVGIASSNNKKNAEPYYAINDEIKHDLNLEPITESHTNLKETRIKLDDNEDSSIG